MRARDRKDLPIAGISGKWIEVPIQEPTFSLVEHLKRIGFISFHSSDCLQKHGLGFLGGAELGLRKRRTLRLPQGLRRQ